ncbi:helix-turn-helix domain-containing protein [Fictibacillus norfolkensis]|uniref:Transcriptional regulator n=1 Tax=Fictibacillus norfolkensis TaxID=2762233 RepID=A0ABR8SRW7_9BACL|nr:transcriptional regulator [Fictibacillus norfolkensis]MBD7966249.1 transcriptional regulator [Fictibacillus norfolkensis]
MDAAEFGAYIKTLRKNNGFTLIDLGEQTQLSQPYLSQIENGKKGIPSPEILRKLAEPLGVSYINLMEKAGYYAESSFILHAEEFFNEVENEIKIEKQFREISPKNSKPINIADILKKPKIFYNDHLINEHDKKLITAYLDILYSGRSKKEE